MTLNSSRSLIIISDVGLGKMDNAHNVLKDISSIIKEFAVKSIRIVYNSIEMPASARSATMDSKSPPTEPVLFKLFPPALIALAVPFGKEIDVLNVQ